MYRAERQAGVVVVEREQIVSALCVQSGEAGRGGCGWERTDCECTMHTDWRGRQGLLWVGENRL